MSRRTQWKRFLSAVDNRLLESGTWPLWLVNSMMTRVFNSHWSTFKASLDRFLDAHAAIEAAVVVLVMLPALALFYIMGVPIAAIEECAKVIELAIANLWWWWLQPRRNLLSKKEVAKRKELRRSRDEVKTLPKMRPRALTLRSDGAPPSFVPESRRHDPTRVRQTTVDQLGSSDLYKLPFEVRELIWKYAVGGNHVHIVKRRRRWGSVFCPAPDPTDPTHRDFCTRRDDDGYHVLSAWPRDTKPLALLLSCRQIYSECIALLYLRNTFAFDNPGLLDPFLRSLLPSRARLITSFHLAPVFGHEWPPSNSKANRPRVEETISHLEPFLDILEQYSGVQSLSITPTLSLYFTSECDDILFRNAVGRFTKKLSLMKMSTSTTLAWPRDMMYYAPHFRLTNVTDLWAQEENLPPEETGSFKIREIPWQAPSQMMDFFIPFDVQCLHCAEYTIIRRATWGAAEVSFVPLLPSPVPPEVTTLSSVITRYWTFHGFCGGWMEFQYDGGRKEWSVQQGAQRIAAEDADAHLATAEGLARRYPPLGNPHEKLGAIALRDIVTAPRSGWAADRSIPFWSPRTVDAPTRETYYWNVGWGRGQRDGETDAQ